MEDITAALLQVLTTVLVALVVALVSYLSLALRNFLENKKVKMFLDRLKAEHSMVYVAVSNLALAAEKMALSEAHEFATGDRYDYVKQGALKHLNFLSENRGLPIKMSEEQLDAMIESAVVEAEKTYRDSLRKKTPKVSLNLGSE